MMCFITPVSSPTFYKGEQDKKYTYNVTLPNRNA